MANHLPRELKVRALAALAEGSSIRSIERMTGAHRDTIMRLGIRVGEACQVMHDEKMRNLDCHKIQVDEIWGFIGKKQKRVKARECGKGDIWTFIALDAETKLVPAFLVGDRDAYHARTFMEDLSSRLRNRIQLSTDALAAYVEAVERGFGSEVDFGQIVKTYATSGEYPEGKYSPPEVVAVKKSIITGTPAPRDISTSYVERQNLTIRMHMRRLTRLTNAFSKKLENFKAAVALHFAYYNFVRTHRTVRMPPALAAGVSDHIWTVEELLTLSGE